MPKPHYNQKPYQFGKSIQLLRTSIGLTQKEVAQHLGVSSKAVYNWEAAITAIEEEHLKRLLLLFLTQHAFIVGKEREEIEAIWNNARASSPLLKEIDSIWLTTQLQSKRVWELIADQPAFLGRERELAQLEQWIGHCRVIAIFGGAGIGKTTLSIKLAQQFATQFNYVIWQSLHHAPDIQQFLADCQQSVPFDLNKGIASLLHLFQQQRCLLILDNFESLLQDLGEYRPDREEYRTLLEQVAKGTHQSCLILTSREIPYHLSDNPPIVRTLRLEGLDVLTCKKILQEKGLEGSASEWEKVVHRYSGNPLALKIVAEEIRDVFGSTLTRFLSQDHILFHGIRELLHLQFRRLSFHELEIMYCLALAREPLSFEEMTERLPARSSGILLDALGALRRRSLIERGPHAAFFLLPTLLEYTTEQLIREISKEIAETTIKTLTKYPLLRSRKEYIRQSQVRFVIQPLLEQLQGEYQRGEVLLLHLIEKLRTTPKNLHGFAGGNLVNLLVHLRGDIRCLDFSQIAIRYAHLIEVNAQEASFAHAEITESRFTDAFGGISCLAFSNDGASLAAGHFDRCIRIWRQDGIMTHLIEAHSFLVWRIAFSPDGAYLVSGGHDGEVKIWDAVTGQCIRVLPGHSQWVRSIAMHPTGHCFATGSDDNTIRIWNRDACIRIIQQNNAILSVAFTPDGQRLASSSITGDIKIWQIETGECLQIMATQIGLEAIAFSPDGTILACAGMDGTITFWDLSLSKCLHTIQAHQGKVLTIAFNTDGTLLASGSHNGEVKVWSLDENHPKCLWTLSEASIVWAVTFSPDGTLLASGSLDGVLKTWKLDDQGRNLELFNTLRGYTHIMSVLAWSPDGTLIANGDNQGTITLREYPSGKVLYRTQAHAHIDGRINTLAFSPDGTLLASGSDDRTIKLWKVQTGKHLRTLSDHNNNIWSVAFSLDSHWLASSCITGEVKIWQIPTGQCFQTLSGHTAWALSVAFSPDGHWLASGGADGSIKIWQISSGECVQTLEGDGSPIIELWFSSDSNLLMSSSTTKLIKGIERETGRYLINIPGQHESNWIRTVAISSPGKLLVSKGTHGTVNVWSVPTGQHVQLIEKQGNESISSVSISLDETLLALGDTYGAIRVFQVGDGKLINTFQSDRPYEQMDITGVTGLTTAQKATFRLLGATEKFAD